MQESLPDSESICLLLRLFLQYATMKLEKARLSAFGATETDENRVGDMLV